MAERIGGPPEHHRNPAGAALPTDQVVRAETARPWTFTPIGVVRSTFRYVHDAPRQPRPGARATIELAPGMQNCARDLQGFERIWVLFVFSFARGWKPTVRPPRDAQRRGVLATRAPHRPNPIGLSCVRLHEVVGCTLHISEHDLLDRTPVLDLKPYIPYCDAHPEAAAGWTSNLDPHAADHRWE